MSRRAVCALLLFGVCLSEHALAQPAVGARPVADHHGHLQSIAVWELFNARLPTIDLPQEIDSVLRGFERGWQAADNKTALAALFTEDGLFQHADDWLRGRPAIRMMLVGEGGPVRLRAQSASVTDTAGHVAGAYGFYRNSTWVDQGRFVFTLHLASGEGWRIAVGMLRATTPSPKPAKDPYDAADYIKELDSAGISQGVVLSWAYQIGAAFRTVQNEAALVRAENAWTGQQAARFPTRLVAFCSVNPLKPYALAELASCRRDPNITGIKLHFTTAFVDLRDPAHVAQLAAFFAATDAHGFPIVVHLRTMNPLYGRDDAETFLRDVLPHAPNVPVQIAHLSGWGGFGPETDAALEVFARAIESDDPRTRRVLFDVSQVVAPGFPDATLQLIVRRLRQIGLDRIVFAVDRADEPLKAWESVQRRPMRPDELVVIAGRVAPYLMRRDK